MKAETGGRASTGAWDGFEGLGRVQRKKNIVKEKNSMNRGYFSHFLSINSVESETDGWASS